MVSTTDEIVTEVAPVEVTPTEVKTIISDEDFEKATKLFQTGKKNLFLNKYDESVNNIGDACKTYASKFGEMDPQCAEVYFFYGRALLELARVENTVLGNALTGVPEETGDIDDSRYGNPEDVAADEKDEIAEKVMDALCSTDEELKAAEQATTTTNDETTEVKPTVEETTTTTTTPVEATPAVETIPATETPATTTETPVEETVEGEEEEDEEAEDEETAEGEENKEDADDIGNLQSSWEMFELAKVIYTKNFNEDTLFKNKRIAECLLKLGEISIEQETYEQAIVDITESIRVQEEIASVDRDERMLAESYYQLGLCRQFNNQFGDANEAYQRCINIVQLRIEKLKGRLLGLGEGPDADLEKTTINEEIAELDALLPEMTSKLEEVNEQGQQTLNLIKEAKECFTSNIDNKLSTPTTVNGDVKDITCMVKSKRKIDNTDDISSIKKTRLSAEGTEVEVTPTENIEVDENKENKVEEPVRMEETKETVVTESETAAAVPEPVATA